MSKQTDYWDTVESIANEALEEASEACEDSGILVDMDSEYFRELVITFVHESVDGSSYIVYTAEQCDVIAYTKNGEAYKEFGPLTGDFSKIQTRVAFCAMERDVMDKLVEKSFR